MAPEITMLWESEPTANGYRLKVSLVPKGGLTVALLERRTLVVRAKETDPPQAWFGVAQIGGWAPMPIAEFLRLVDHFCDFYEPELKKQLPALAAKLVGLPEQQPEATPGSPPHGQPLN
jgi:hypothetical protein